MSVCPWLLSIFPSPSPLLARKGDVPFPRKEDGALLYDNIDYKLTWAAMEKLVEKGLVRSIGLSNFNSLQIDDILSVASIKPTVLQVWAVCNDETFELLHTALVFTPL